MYLYVTEEHGSAIPPFQVLPCPTVAVLFVELVEADSIGGCSGLSSIFAAASILAFAPASTPPAPLCTRAVAQGVNPTVATLQLAGPAVTRQPVAVEGTKKCPLLCKPGTRPMSVEGVQREVTALNMVWALVHDLQGEIYHALPRCQALHCNPTIFTLTPKYLQISLAAPMGLFVYLIQHCGAVLRASPGNIHWRGMT